MALEDNSDHPLHRQAHISRGAQRLVAIACGLVLLLLARLRLPALDSPVPAFDETAHLAGAYENGFHGTNALNAEHPPLIKLLAGWSLRLLVTLDVAQLDAHMTREDEWHFGQSLLMDRLELPATSCARPAFERTVRARWRRARGAGRVLLFGGSARFQPPDSTR